MIDLASIKDVSVFAEHVGSLFHIELGPDQVVDVKLVEADALTIGSGSAGLSREPFSLLFAVQGDINLQQQTYQVSHEQLGELPLFLVPVGPGQLESIFN